jgi:hypothetical protein
VTEHRRRPRPRYEAVTAALALAALLLGACATPAPERISVPMRCDAEVRDAIDCKLLEFNCRNAGGTWTGTACR